ILELPRENEEFSSDNKEEPKIQEHEELRLRTYFSSDKQLKKVSGGELKKQEFSLTEATHDKQFWLSASLKSGHSEDESHPGIISEFNAIKTQYIMQNILPYMCIIAVRNEGENVLNGMLKNGVGTLDFCVRLYPDQEVVSAKMIKTFKQRGSPTYGIISKVAVHKSARQQGVASLMLKLVIEFANQKGISQIFLQVHRRNKPAQALFGKMGFTITDARVTPLQEKPNMYTCSLDL
ncbi:hypothetical protein MKW94_009484, partial [Papaver nudicaule]|nr:hypothetical protein [Papaver nudicaule]